MRRNSGFKALTIVISTIFLYSCSCSCSYNQLNQASLSFTQESLVISVNQELDLLNIIDYKNVVNGVIFTLEDNDNVLSLTDTTIKGLKVGECTVKAIYQSLVDTLEVSVVTNKPQVSYLETNYEFDISKGVFPIKDKITVSPLTATLELSSTRTDFSFSNGNITFGGTGNYSFTLKAKYQEAYSANYNFTVYAYDYLKLDGRGTVENPFIIATASDLKELSDEVLNYKDLKDRYFLQAEDIDISEYDNWTPIGTFGVPFEGIYNGNNKKVTGLNINTHDSWQGLFGFSSGTIKNLTVYGEVNVTCHPDYVYSHSFCAGICGGLYNNALVDNCTNYANVHGDSYVGGIVGGIARSDEMIVGREQSQIVNCKNYGVISGDDTFAINESAMYFGGIVGESLGILTGNENYGEVNVTGTKTKYVGGVCGLGYIIYKYGMYFDEPMENYANNDNINHGKVTGYHSVGGVFGANVLPSHGCINYGEVNGDICVGGVSGLNGTSSVLENNYSISLLENCENYGKIRANLRYSGGITSCSYFDVNSCVNYGEVTGGPSVYYVGGVVGYQSNGNIFNCESDELGTVTGYHSVGGIVGHSNTNSLSITSCVNHSKVSSFNDADDESVHIGGIAGILGTNNTINDCNNYGEVTGKGTRNSPSRWGGIGGIAGSIYNSSKIFNSKNYGDVTGKQQVGGIFGYSNGNILTAVQDCQNQGDIKSTHSDPHLGGIAGRINGTALFNCLNSGNLVVESGATNVGDIYGSAASATNNGNKVSGDGYSPYFYLFSGGKGYEDDPFIIRTTKDFELLRERVSSTDENASQEYIYYKLDADITVTGGLLSTKEFKGVFDGNNHCITFNYSNTSKDEVALFGINRGFIKDLVVAGSITGRNYLASVAVTNYGTIENCKNHAIISGNSRIGGVVVTNKGVINNCLNEATITGSSQYLGGIAGVNGSDSEGGTIINSVNEGPVECTASTSQYSFNGNCVGGVVGFVYGNSQTVITNCYNSANVQGRASLGGITGFIKSGTGATISNLINTGNITGVGGSDGATYCGHIGGIVGMLGSNVDISNCYSTGDVSGNGGKENSNWRGVGGIVGSFYAGTISECFSTGSVIANMLGGGIVGYSQGTASKTVSNCISGGSYSNSSDNGGILGRGNNTTIKDSISFASGVESRMIYGYGSTVNSTNNSTFTGSSKMNLLLGNLIFGLATTDHDVAVERLELIAIALSQLNSVDTTILNSYYSSTKTIQDFYNEVVAYLENIINGGTL